MKKLILLAAGMMLSSQVFAATVRSTDYACYDLQYAVQAYGYLSINGGWVVADRSMCAIHQTAESAVVTAADGACYVGVTCVDRSGY